MYKGLDPAEVRKRLLVHGYNELPSATRKNFAKIAWEVAREPMFLLLLSCGGLYLVLGNTGEGVVLLCTIVIIISITFFQYRKTERALEALKQLSSPRVLVIRESRETRVTGREIVPGDVIILSEGDRVPADGEVLEAVNLLLDESVLTGESLPVSKHPGSGGNMLYSGTLVTAGRAVATVTRTGRNSQLGGIARSIEGITEEPTILQREMKSLIRRLSLAAIIICLGIVAAFYLTRGNIIRSALNGLAAAMAILPEEFPVVLTVFLALGAWRLSGRNVLTRKPVAIETLGAATVLCSDKTGTITQNKMEVAALSVEQGTFERPTSDNTNDQLVHIVSVAKLASADNSTDPMEKALSALFLRMGLSGEKSQLVREYPLTRDIPAMTRVVRAENAKGMLINCKGAPETVFALCRMSPQERERQTARLNALASRGYRVLGVCSASFAAEALPESQYEFLFTFIGLVAFEDPIRPEVPLAMKECVEAGIRIIMITGDFPATATCIAEQAGLPNLSLVTGTMLRDMPDGELRDRISGIGIFARVVPEQKLRIVRALQENGEIVAMTGDGVNDAPALKAANIGVAMGIKGTDVAREAASLVLLDDNFASIVSAIRSGRRIFDNLQKAMSYIIAIHIPIIGLTLIPAFVSSIPLFLLPLHIVFMELIIDPVCSVAFESEREEMGIMKHPPRNRNEKFFGIRLMGFSVLQGLLLLALVLVVYQMSKAEGHTEGEIRAIAFSTLIVGNVFLIATSLSRTRSFLSFLAERNVAAISILFGATALLILTISVRPLQHLFSFSFPGYAHFIPALLGAGTLLLTMEVIKFFRRRRVKRD